MESQAEAVEQVLSEVCEQVREQNCDQCIEQDFICYGCRQAKRAKLQEEMHKMKQAAASFEQTPSFASDECYFDGFPWEPWDVVFNKLADQMQQKWVPDYKSGQ